MLAAECSELRYYDLGLAVGYHWRLFCMYEVVVVAQFFHCSLKFLVVELKSFALRKELIHLSFFPHLDSSAMEFY